MTLAELIRAWRKTREGLTQAKLAEAIGVSKAAVGFWETRGQKRTEPTHTNVAKLADFFSVTVPQFLAGPPSNEGAITPDTAATAGAS